MKKENDPLLLKNQLCFPIYLCSKEMIRKYKPFLAKLDLTYTQYIVMMYFWEKKRSNVKKLGKALLLDPSTLTPVLIKLEKKGYVSRLKSDADGRNLDVTITERGEKLKDEALSAPERMKECIALSKEEADILYKLIYKILINIERSETK